MKKNLFYVILFLSNSLLGQDIASDGEIEAAKSSEISQLKPGLYSAVADDVYVELYLARIVKARMDLKQEQASLKLYQTSADRQRRLVEQRATSRQEYDEALSRLQNSKARILALKSIIAEKRAMFNIAIDRVTIGLDMPICADVQ
ncbi:hypothetical protein N9D31_03375 [Oligoflexaceae bacterium]|nr:hypothetical protein [Oligoflexaceae bacterium]